MLSRCTYVRGPHPFGYRVEVLCFGNCDAGDLLLALRKGGMRGIEPGDVTLVSAHIGVIGRPNLVVFGRELQLDQTVLAPTTQNVAVSYREHSTPLLSSFDPNEGIAAASSRNGNQSVAIITVEVDRWLFVRGLHEIQPDLGLPFWWAQGSHVIVAIEDDRSIPARVVAGKCKEVYDAQQDDEELDWESFLDGLRS
ncbi:hypothetical protein [Beihai barnacle virus 3]|uniref:hypothetical protein n=1 Tax=Beihai barnacle virus 3 TaxID=1922361 RepID=UPI00090B6DAF|nr:hypothetical protein [Beihai barnacle virus 3]APG77569.1 hypothetical protein [Beihai barnacle virus 3]